MRNFGLTSGPAPGKPRDRSRDNSRYAPLPANSILATSAPLELSEVRKTLFDVLFVVFVCAATITIGAGLYFLYRGF